MNLRQQLAEVQPLAARYSSLCTTRALSAQVLQDRILRDRMMAQIMAYAGVVQVGEEGVTQVSS
jgi:hypothetical protein